MMDVPAWLNYGAFGLLCLVLLGAGWFGRWVVTKFFEGILKTLSDLNESSRALRDEVISLRSDHRTGHKSLASRLDQISEDLDRMNGRSQNRKSRPDDPESLPPDK